MSKQFKKKNPKHFVLFHIKSKCRFLKIKWLASRFPQITQTALTEAVLSTRLLKWPKPTKAVTVCSGSDVRRFLIILHAKRSRRCALSHLIESPPPRRRSWVFHNMPLPLLSASLLLHSHLPLCFQNSTEPQQLDDQKRSKSNCFDNPIIASVILRANCETFDGSSVLNARNCCLSLQLQ